MDGLLFPTPSWGIADLPAWGSFIWICELHLAPCVYFWQWCSFLRHGLKKKIIIIIGTYFFGVIWLCSCFWKYVKAKLLRISVLAASSGHFFNFVLRSQMKFSVNFCLWFSSILFYHPSNIMWMLPCAAAGLQRLQLFNTCTYLLATLWDLKNCHCNH